MIVAFRKVYDWSNLSIIDAVKLLHGRDPNKFPIGILLQDSFIKYICWFEDDRELLTYIVTKDPYICGHDAEQNRLNSKYVNDISNVVYQFQYGWSDELKDQIADILTEMESDLSFAWVGTFDEMRHGRGLARVYLEEFAQTFPDRKMEILRSGVPDDLVGQLVEKLKSYADGGG